MKHKMKSNAIITNESYSLWVDGELKYTFPHTREGSDDAFAEAFEVDGKAEIFSSRDDLVWSSEGNEELAYAGGWE